LCAFETPALIRTQSFGYVLPSQPQTGRKILGQNRGIAAQVPVLSNRPHVPSGKLQKEPESHGMPKNPPQVAPTGTAFAGSGSANCANNRPNAGIAFKYLIATSRYESGRLLFKEWLTIPHSSSSDKALQRCPFGSVGGSSRVALATCLR
jgi:hypothetical protein